MRKAALAAVVAVSLFLTGSAVGALAAHSAGPWTWFQGDDQAYVGRQQGTSDLSVYAAKDVNVLATHIRMGSRDGNFEFEHGEQRDGAHFSAYSFAGIGNTRTPIIIGGGDDQDLVSLIVGGKAGQKSDLQQWSPSGSAKLAVDGQGRLRLGKVTLAAVIRRGRAQLIAILPNGTQQVLASAAK